MMAETVDASGLSCPQPVLMTLNKIKALGQGEIEILVDTDTSKENVSRAAESQGWEVGEVSESDTGYRVVIRKG
jgi:TusA-related sulfurtransferase